MNIREEIDKIRDDGYNEANAEARLRQDIILKAIAESSLKKKRNYKRRCCDAQLMVSWGRGR